MAAMLEPTIPALMFVACRPGHRQEPDASRRPQRPSRDGARSSRPSPDVAFEAGDGGRRPRAEGPVRRAPTEAGRRAEPGTQVEEQRGRHVGEAGAAISH